jgi:hypothetical protein
MTDKRELEQSEFAEGYQLGHRLGYEAARVATRREFIVEMGQNPRIPQAAPSRFAAFLVTKEYGR